MKKITGKKSRRGSVNPMIVAVLVTVAIVGAFLVLALMGPLP